MRSQVEMTTAAPGTREATHVLRVGLIGLGTIHRAHLEGYARLGHRVRISAVCDTQQSQIDLHTRCMRYSPAEFTDFHEMVTSGLVDVVDIMLPHSLHVPVAEDAIEHGLHVLMEKPLAPSLELANRLIKLAAARGTVLGVAENTRFVDAYMATHGLIESASLGAITRVRTTIAGSEEPRLRDPGLWKGRAAMSGGGAILDEGAHSFYLLTWLFGGVSDLRAVAWRKVEQSEIEDNAIIVGTLRNGAEFTAEFSFTAQMPWSERLEVYGTSGTLIVDQLSDPVARMFTGPKDMTGQILDGITYDPMGWKQRSIAAGIEDFMTSIAEGHAASIDLKDVVRAAAAIDAAYTSVAGKGELVAVPDPYYGGMQGTN